MSENCNHDCASCGESCSSRTVDPASFRAEPNKMTHVKKIIAVASGKGGVGKSLVTSMLAVAMRRKGYRTAILDADITGPSVPQEFGLHQMAQGNELGIFPVQTQTDISVMSLNLLLEHDTDPVVWRGPVIANMVKQFWTDVVWGDVDYLFVDMPPGTGDVPLTVFQSLPVDGVVIVTSPQELVSMIVSKAVNMASEMKIPVLGIVENMSYYKCPDCGAEHSIFGESHIREIADGFGIDTVVRMPIRPDYAALADAGRIESVETDALDAMVSHLESLQ